MRILLLTQSYPPVLGGLQTAAHSVARHLLQQGHDVRVVTNRYPRNLPDNELLDGVLVRRWTFLSPELSLLRARPALFLAAACLHPASLWRLDRLMREFLPHVVNVHFPDVQIASVLRLRRKFPFRLVVSLHGHEIERYAMPASNGHCHVTPSATAGLQTLLQQADAVTACSRDLLEQAIRLAPSVATKGIPLANGIEPLRFADETVFHHPRPYLFAFGRLTYKKGFDLLIDAFARIPPGASRPDLIIAGDGEERSGLEEQSRRLGLAEHVHFFGRATPVEIVQLLNGSRFVVVPSRSEPFGIVALEALAAGKPILATRVGGLRELLGEICQTVRAGSVRESATAPSDTVGPDLAVQLVEPTIGGLFEGLRNWICDEPAPTGRAICRTHVLQEYSWSRAARRYAEVLVA